MKFLDHKTIKIDKEMNSLDRFVFDFIKILQKHSSYVLVSGYVSLFFGRTRTTEDIDLIVVPMNKKQFGTFYADVQRHGFWCINAQSEETLFDQLKETAIRFARKGSSIPNMEFKFAKTLIDHEALASAITIVTPSGNISMSNLEMQIAFKKYILKSDKDIEDARHLEVLFKGKINKSRLADYAKRFKNAL